MTCFLVLCWKKAGYPELEQAIANQVEEAGPH